MKMSLLILALIPALLSAGPVKLSEQQAAKYFALIDEFLKGEFPPKDKWEDESATFYRISSKKITIKHLRFSPLRFLRPEEAQELTHKTTACLKNLGFISKISQLDECQGFEPKANGTEPSPLSRLTEKANRFQSGSLNEIDKLKSLYNKRAQIDPSELNLLRIMNLQKYYTKSELEYLLVYDEFSKSEFNFEDDEKSFWTNRKFYGRINKYKDMARALDDVSETKIVNCGICPNSFYLTGCLIDSMPDASTTILGNFSKAKVNSLCEDGVEGFTAPEVYDLKSRPEKITDFTLSDVFSLGMVFIHLENMAYKTSFNSVSELESLKAAALQNVADYYTLDVQKTAQDIVKDFYSLIGKMVAHIDQRISIKLAFNDLVGLFLKAPSDDLLVPKNFKTKAKKTVPSNSKPLVKDLILQIGKPKTEDSFLKLI